MHCRDQEENYMIASRSWSKERNSFSLVDQSCKVISKLEIEDDENVDEVTRITKQMLVVRVYQKVYLISVKRSRLALVKKDVVAWGKEQIIHSVYPIDDRSFLLKLDDPDKLLLLKLKF